MEKVNELNNVPLIATKERNEKKKFEKSAAVAKRKRARLVLYGHDQGRRIIHKVGCARFP